MEKRKKYLIDITRVQEEERKRLSRELHDEVAQSLSLLILELDAICQREAQIHGDTLRKLEKLKETAANILNEVRRFSHELRPSILDNLGLVAAVESLTEDLSGGHQIRVNFSVSGGVVRMPAEVELALFRIAQEALNNIRKHSGASKAQINLRFTHRKVKLSIIDNGKGFTITGSQGLATTEHLGIIGMKERANLIHGKLQIKSIIGRGTTITIEAPTI